MIHIEMDLATPGDLADNVSFILVAPAPPGKPAIQSIISAGAFGAFPSIAPGTWIEIYGSNLAPNQRTWGADDFKSGVGPTSLGGVSVSIGGKPAFVAYVSPGQVNALTPSGSPLGSVQISVTTPDATSQPYLVNIDPTEPGLLAPSTFVVGGKQYLAAFLPDNVTFVLPANAIAGVPSRPARPAETITIYAVGFGPVDAGTPAGTIATGITNIIAPLQVTIGDTPATVAYSGLVPGLVGLYQLNVMVPNIADNDAAPVAFTLSGLPGSQGITYIAVHK